MLNFGREGTVFLVLEHFFQEFQQIMAELRHHPKSLFLYLKTVIEVQSMGTMSFSSLRKFIGTRVKNQTDRVYDFLERLSEFPKSLRENPVHVTDEMTELYLEVIDNAVVLYFQRLCIIQVKYLLMILKFFYVHSDFTLLATSLVLKNLSFFGRHVLCF